MAWRVHTRSYIIEKHRFKRGRKAAFVGSFLFQPLRVTRTLRVYFLAVLKALMRCGFGIPTATIGFVCYAAPAEYFQAH